MRTLDISDNNIGGVEGDALIKGLDGNTTIQELNVANYDIYGILALVLKTMT